MNKRIKKKKQLQVMSMTLEQGLQHNSAAVRRAARKALRSGPIGREVEVCGGFALLDSNAGYRVEIPTMQDTMREHLLGKKSE